MRKIIAVSLMLCLANIPLLEAVAMPVPLLAGVSLPQDNPAGTPQPQDNPAGAPLPQNNPAGAPQPQDNPAGAPQPQDNNGGYQPYAPEQLDNLLAPIALYPDPLLAQVFPAATFVDQVQQAAAWVSSNGPNGIDEQPWDISVKAVAHYPMVIQMMAQRLDWTTAVGQAFVNQSTDVMQSVQRLRGMARIQGNLYSTPQQTVIYQGGYVQIVPAQPQYIFVPTYNPQVVYFQPHYQAMAMGVVVGFGAGLMIGAWLSRDVDWGGNRVYYAGWQGGGYGGGWRMRSMNYVNVNNSVYVNNVYTNVTINRTVVNRTVNVTNINTYNTVHQNVTYNNVVHNNTVVRTHPFVPNTPQNKNAAYTPSPASQQFHSSPQRPYTPTPAPGRFGQSTSQPAYRQPGAQPGQYTPRPAYGQPQVQPGQTTPRPAYGQSPTRPGVAPASTQNKATVTPAPKAGGSANQKKPEKPKKE